MTLLVNKWGENPDTDASLGAEDIISEGGLQYWAESASILDISSSSASDTAAGVGARTLVIAGLDADYRPVMESVKLNGTTTANTKHSYLRVNRAFIVKVGTSQHNVGDVTISDGTGIMAYILATFGQTAKAAFTVPSGVIKPAVMLLTGQVMQKTAASVLCHLMTRSYGQGWRVRYPIGLTNTSLFLLSGDVLNGMKLRARDDVRIHAFDASADNLVVAAGFSIGY